MSKIFALVIAALLLTSSGWAAYALKTPHPVTHNIVRTVTVTKTAPPITRWRTHKVKVIRWRTQTQTVTAPDPAAVNCIHVLYDNIQFWKQNGGMVPNGWWDARCIAYIP
jgi:hypothetical protein